MTKEKISVVIPAYNLRDVISRTMDSVLGQTYHPIEIIVVDDGSTDGTADILDEYSRKYPNVLVIHRANGGVSSARLEGIKAATGEWIGFVDGDDEVEPDMYEVLMNNAVKYHADISHCGYQMMFVDGHVNFFYNTGRLVQQDKITGLKDLLSGSFVEPGLWNKLFHKKLFHSLLHDNSMPTDIKINEDLLMNYILFAQANQSVYEDQCKYHYLIRSGSTSRSGLNWNKIYDPIRVKELICEMKIAGMKEESRKALLATCMNVYNTLIMDHTGHWKEHEKVVCDKIRSQKETIGLLRAKQKVRFVLLLHFRVGYNWIYKFYCKYFQQKKYE